MVYKINKPAILTYLSKVFPFTKYLPDALLSRYLVTKVLRLMSVLKVLPANQIMFLHKRQSWVINSTVYRALLEDEVLKGTSVPHNKPMKARLLRCVLDRTFTKYSIEEDIFDDFEKVFLQKQVNYSFRRICGH